MCSNRKDIKMFNTECYISELKEVSENIVIKYTQSKKVNEVDKIQSVISRIINQCLETAESEIQAELEKLSMEINNKKEERNMLK